MKLQDAYCQKIEAQVEELNARIAVMRAQAKRFAASAKIAASEELSETDKKLAELNVRLGKLRKAGSGAWREMRKGVGTAWTELSSASMRAKKHFESSPPQERPAGTARKSRAAKKQPV
jgi:hypothetical protein